MKKTFPINDRKNTPARAIEAIKSELRKYVKRERKKKLPEGVDFWDFDCKVGESADKGAATARGRDQSSARSCAGR